MEETERNEETQVRTSQLAQTSFILAILMFVLPFGGLFTVLLAPFCGILAFILGIAGLVSVSKSGGRLVGRKRAILGIVLPLLALCFLLILIPALARVPMLARRMTCANNLSMIGKAMLIYTNDNQSRFPCAGGQGGTRWANSIPDWTAQDRNQAFGLDPTGQGGQATISSSLYLLIRYTEATPRNFVCKGDSIVKEFSPVLYQESKNKKLTDLWDFGPEPWTTFYSYAYHLPYGRYPLNTSCDPRLAVAADCNPWIARPYEEPNAFTEFQPDYYKPWKGTSDQAKIGNSLNHQRDGQNVLYLDGHVTFKKRSFVGIDNDNIYTRWDGEDKIRGTPPDMMTQPSDRTDSLLVHDPPAKSTP